MTRLGRGLLAAFSAALFATGPAWAQATGMEAALASMLARHPTLAAKQSQVQARQFAIEAVGAQRYPSLQALAQQSADQGGQALVTAATLRLRQPIWAFGRIDSAMANAEADLRVERLDLLRLQRQLIDTTASAYAKAWSAQQRLQVSRENLAAHEDLLAQIRRREAGQLASVADVRLAGARLAQAVAQRERHDGELALALEELRALTIEPVAANQAVPARWLPVSDLAQIEASAQERAAELRLRRAQVRQAQAQLAQTEKAALPTVYLQADHARNAGAAAPDTRYSVVLEGNVEGLGLASRSRAAEAQARVRAAEEELNSAHNELRRSLRSAWQGRLLAQALRGTQGNSLGELGALLESYKRQYAAGTKAWMDVLNMQREISEQRLQLVQAEADWLVNSLRLSAVTAGLDAAAGVKTDDLDD